MKNLTNLSLIQARELLNKKEVSSVELTQECLKTIQQTKQINALISIDEKFAC